MKKIAILLLAALAFAADGKKAEDRLAALSWLAGDWSGEMWGGVFHAYYSTPEGGRILSYSYLKKQEKQVFYEFEKLDVQDGKVSYTPFPGGQRKEQFLLTDAKENAATFEQPKKDFPTKIVFERQDRTLRITLSDPHNNSPKKEIFVLTRQP